MTDVVLTTPDAAVRRAVVPRANGEAVGLRLVAAGVIAQIAGLLDDAWLHRTSTALADHEGPLTLTNPAHLAIVAGLVLTAAGVWTGLVEPRLRGWVARVLVPVALAGVLGSAGALASIGSARASGSSHASLSSNASASVHVAPTVNGAAAHGQTTGGAPDEVLDGPTRAALVAELGLAAAITVRYPTLADAIRAGYRLAAPYDKGIGSHYMKFSAIDTHFDAAEPEMLLYDGDDPSSRVAGVMYYVIDANAPPGGFAGPYDHWHVHAETCVNSSGAHFIGDDGGTLCGHAGQFAWMLHVWVVPDRESVEGTFSERNDSLA